MQRIPVDAVHVTPTPYGRFFYLLDSEILQLRGVAILFNDRKALRAMNFIRMDVFFKKTNLLSMRLIAIVLVQRGNDFFADIEKLRLQTDKHSGERRLPRLLINHAPAPILQL